MTREYSERDGIFREMLVEPHFEQRRYSWGRSLRLLDDAGFAIAPLLPCRRPLPASPDAGAERLCQRHLTAVGRRAVRGSLERQLAEVAEKLNAISTRASAIKTRCDRFNRSLAIGARTPKEMRKLAKKANRQKHLFDACINEARVLKAEKDRLVAALGAGKCK